MKLWAAQPEAYALRKLRWQLFATLTFAPAIPSARTRTSLVFAWLRDVSGYPRFFHFKDLLWVFRYECGRGGRGHFHLCIAGLPARAIESNSREALSAMWTARTRGLADVAEYDPARDGVGYMLKIAPRRINERAGVLSRGWDDRCEPTLSVSVLKLFRR